MTEGFRIAEGYVEVSTKLNKEQIRAAAREAATEFDSASTGRYERVGEHAGNDFAAGVLSTHETIERGLREAGDRSGEQFSRRVGDRLRDEKGRFVAAGGRLGEDIAGGAERTLFSRIRDIGQQSASRVGDAFSGLPGVLSETWGAFGKVGSAASAAAMPTAIFAGVLAALEIGPPILYAIGGALAAIPALALGAGSALATLELGTHGIGAAIGEVFNPKAGGGGGGAAIDQIASAERRLATAQRDEREAQQALSDARRQAVFDLQDLNLQLDRAHTSEKSAALAVLEARQELMRAQAQGDPLILRRAQIGLEQANESLAEAKQHTIELTAKKEEADTKGVEGSDRVVAANDRVTNSINSVIDAQNAVKQASISAGGAAVTAYSKLSPEAKKFVDEIARLKPELIGIQQYVQDKLFAGLDRKLDTWAHVWIPDARRNLGMLAEDGNQLFSRLGDDLSKPEFVAAFDKVNQSMDRVFDRFTTGGTLDKVVAGVTALVDKATPFIEDLANSALDKLGDWGDQLTKAGKDGSLDRFFKEAAKDAHDLWAVGKDVFDIIGDILDAVMGQDTSRHQGQNSLDRLKDTLDDVKAWAESDGGKKTLKDVADAVIDISDGIGKVAGWIGEITKLSSNETFRSIAKPFMDTINPVGELATWLGKLDFGKVRRGAEDFWHGTVDAFRSVKDEAGQVWHRFVGFILTDFKVILDGAVAAFSWIPGLGPKLDKARKDFDGFVDRWNRDVDRMQSSKDFIITVHNAQASGTSGHGAQGKGGALQRWGGVRYAEDGLMSLDRGSAGIYGNGPLYGFAEPDTGGEIFIPKNGDEGRNKALTAVAMQWSGILSDRGTTGGGAPAAGMAAQSAPTRVLQPVTINIGGTPLVNLVLGIVEDHPVVVSATAAEGDRTRSFTNSGR